MWPRSLSDKWGGARAWLLDQGVPFFLSLNEIICAPWLQMANDGKDNVSCPYRALHIYFPNRLCATTPRNFWTSQHWKISFFHFHQINIYLSFLKDSQEIDCIYSVLLSPFSQPWKTLYSTREKKIRKKIGSVFFPQKIFSTDLWLPQYSWLRPNMKDWSRQADALHCRGEGIFVESWQKEKLKLFLPLLAIYA